MVRELGMLRESADRSGKRLAGGPSCLISRPAGGFDSEMD
jgi:hypothetical protein